MDYNKILSFGEEIFVNGILITLLVLVVTYIVARILKKIVRRAINNKIEKSAKDMATTYSFISKMVVALINVIALIVLILQFNGFQKVGAAMLGASGIMAVVLGFAAQESMANIIGGFFLSIYKPFNVGDLIQVPEKNLSGKVEEIGMRHTVIKTFSNSRIIVPNRVMNSAVIENKDSQETFCNFLYFDISYQSNIDKAIEIIQRNACSHPMCLDGRTKEEKRQGLQQVPVLVTGLKDFSVELRASIVTLDAATGFKMCCELRKNIKEDFDREGIVIPFPTRTIVQE